MLAAIYQGQITKWNDARIASLNPGVALPASDILVVHRSDGSGTTYVFTDYLASVSPAWATKPGKGKELQWPVGLGAKGNDGVAGQVKQTPGAIGYVELAYATQNKLTTAAIKNASGEFVAPTHRVGHGGGRGRGREAAAEHRLPRLDRQRAGQGGLPDLVVHLDHRLREAGGCGEGEEADRLPALGDDRRAGTVGGARLRPAAGGDADGAGLEDRLDPVGFGCHSGRQP